MVQLIEQVSLRLSHLHEAEACVQIDLKPENVLVHATRVGSQRRLSRLQLMSWLVKEALRTGDWRCEFAPCDMGLAKSLDSRGRLPSLSNAGTATT